VHLGKNLDRKLKAQTKEHVANQFPNADRKSVLLSSFQQQGISQGKSTTGIFGCPLQQTIALIITPEMARRKDSFMIVL